MILSEFVTLSPTGTNVKKYRELGYKFNIGEKVDIKIEDLSENSHIKVDVKCDICGKEKSITYMKYIKNIKNGGYYSCSQKCSSQKSKNTIQSKYGVDNAFQSKTIKEKIKKTNIEKYGVENPMQNKAIKQKAVDTCIEKYGEITSLKNKEVKQKSIETCIEKYGVDNPFKSKEIQEKINKKYISNIEQKIPELIQIKDGKYEIICDNNKDHTFEITPSLYYLRKNRYKSTICTICNPIGISNVSLKEKKLLGFISDYYNGKIITNSKRIISPMELDIYLPDLNLAFEFNGLYWHSEKFKYNNYHMDKYDLCKEKNIELITIWEDDWSNKQDIIKSMILLKLDILPKIDSKNTEAKILDSTIAGSFMEKNSINGYIESDINIGLILNNIILSVISINIKDNKYDIISYCNKIYLDVVNSERALLQYIVDKFNPDKITAKTERCGFYTKKFENIFKNDNIKKMNPDFHFVVNNKRSHIGEGYKIYNSGYFVFEKIKLN